MLTFEEVKKHGPLFVKLYNVIKDDKVIGGVAKIEEYFNSVSGKAVYKWVPVHAGRGADLRAKMFTRTSAASLLKGANDWELK